MFIVRWVASSFRAVSAVWLSFPALSQHFQNASKDETRQSTEKTKFQGLFSKLCTTSFVKNLAPIEDVLNELKNLSETLQNQNTALPKAQNLPTAYTKRTESLIVSLGVHSVVAHFAEEAMSFQEVQLREGRGPVINQAQLIRAVADNMKQRLFPSVSNSAQASVVATRQEMYKNLVGQMAVLNPHNWVHEYP